MPRDDKKPTLSVSGLRMLEKCGVQYDYRYNQGLKVPPGIAAIVGHGVHGAAAAELEHKVEHDGELMALEEAQQRARDEFARSLDNGVAWTADEQEQGIEHLVGQKADEAVSLTTLYHAEYAPILTPHEGRIEWRWKVETDLPFDLIGIIDVETVSLSDDGVTLERCVRDLKTSAKSPGKDAADISTQLTMYALAIDAIDAELPDAVALDYIVALKRGPKAVSLTAARQQADVDVLWQRLERAALVIQAGAFTPAPADAWWCSERFCGYADQCPFFRRPVSAQAAA